MPAVVSDSSPLIYLSRLGRLDLLQRLFTLVLVPPAVWREVAVEGGGRVEAVQVRRAEEAGWLRVETFSSATLSEQSGIERLDEGERQAIGLALERNSTLVIDEAAGRRIARTLGLECVGTLGVLAEAKLRGWLPSLRKELDCLARDTNFRFTPELFEAILIAVDESPRPKKTP